MAVYLRIVQGPGRGQVLPIPNGKPVTLGRSASASYAFDDPLLSRKHCAVECRRDMCRIVDLQSRNGTFVNGQRVGAVLLQTGDRIKIGGLLFEVAPVGAPPPPAPPPSMHGGRPTPVMGSNPVTRPYGQDPRPAPASNCEGCAGRRARPGGARRHPREGSLRGPTIRGGASDAARRVRRAGVPR